MKQGRMIVAGLAATVALAACGGRSSESPELARELEAAAGDSMALLPTRGNLQFVSAIERTNAVPARSGDALMKTPAATAKKPTTRVAVPKGDPLPAPLPKADGDVAAVDPTPNEAPVTVIPAPSEKPAAQGAGRSTTEKMPFPTGDQRAKRRGGWSSTSDVIRNAPFPINP